MADSQSTQPVKLALILALLACVSPRAEQGREPDGQRQNAAPLAPAAPVQPQDPARAQPQAQAPNRQARGGDQWFEGPPIWSNWALVIVAAWGGWLALGSLKALRRDVRNTEQALRLLNQPWLDTTDWQIDVHGGPAIPDGEGGFRSIMVGVIVIFTVVNHSPTPATLSRIDLETDGPEAWHVSETVNSFLPPGGRYVFRTEITPLTEAQRQQYLGGGIAVRGTLHFGDLFQPSRRPTASGPRRRHVGRILRAAPRREILPLPGAEWLESDDDPEREGPHVVDSSTRR
ncbi:MAG: hypothetical protein ABJA98_01830 [Acidobacteriota bacterium]